MAIQQRASQPHLSLSFRFSGEIQDYQKMAQLRELKIPHPEVCPRCGQRCGWTHYDWYWRGLWVVARYMPGVSVQNSGIWVERLSCCGCGTPVAMVPSFRGSNQALCFGGPRRLSA